jgi:DNA-binding XRE family transcriptional regulator
LEGRIWKGRGSRHWLGEVRDLDLVTQGRSRKNVAAMLKDAVEVLIDTAGFRAVVRADAGGRCTVGSNSDARLIALMLKRLRGREGLSVRDVAERLGSSSPNAYAQYETGRVAPSIDTLSRLLAALNPEFEAVLRVA